MSAEPTELETAIETISDHFRHQGGLDHLRYRKWGQSIVIYSGDGSKRDNLVRLTLIEPETWGLSIARHTGRWERTPFVGDLDDILDTVTCNFTPYLRRW